MKNLSLCILTGAIALAALLTPIHSQTPAAGDPFVKDAGGAKANKDAPWQNCLIVLETYALDKNDAGAVLAAERGGAARYRRVLDLQKAGKARLEILTALTTKSGQRATSESIDEVRYATGFKAPVSKKSPVAPVAFETRNVGDTLEVEPVVGPDGRSCDLNILPSHITFAGFKDIGSKGDEALVSQPIFTAQKISTQAKLQANEAAYLGSMTPPTAQGVANGTVASEVWLAFLRVQLPAPTAEEIKKFKGSGESFVNLEYLCYSMERATARDLLTEANTLTGPWNKVQTLIGEGKARFEHLTTINTRSGMRAVNEEIQEVRFAMEYEPESRTPSIETTSRETTNTKGAGEKKTEDSSSNEKTKVVRVDEKAEIMAGFPSAFETRNAGVTLEIEPVVGPDQASVDLNQVYQSVSHRGSLQGTGMAAQYPAQPLFETRKITTSQYVLMGCNVLVGTLNPPGNSGVNERTDTGRTWLVFVRAHNER